MNSRRLVTRTVTLIFSFPDRICSKYRFAESLLLVKTKHLLRKASSSAALIKREAAVSTRYSYRNVECGKSKTSFSNEQIS